jgi:hypothetical protein
MITNIRLSGLNPYPTNNLLKKNQHGNFHLVLHHMSMNGDQAPITHRAHLVTCKGHNAHS